MSKSKVLLKSTSVSSQREVSRSNQTWSNSVQEVLVSQNTDGPSAVILFGGAENGQFVWVGEVLTDRVTYQNEGQLNAGDIVLEVQGQCIAGYTLTDAIEWITFTGRNGSPVMFKTVSPDMLMKDMREFLSTRFLKGSVDHELQQLIRTNIYKRTVPCTTRPMRPGEVDGVDYRFLTIEQFKRLEESGELLESGIFDDNHYGTPKPPKAQPVPSASNDSNFRRSGSANSITGPGLHTSDGKRRRNLSNVEINQTSEGSKSSEEVDAWSSRQEVASAQFQGSALQRNKSLEQLHNGSSNGVSVQLNSQHWSESAGYGKDHFFAESSRNKGSVRIGNNTAGDVQQRSEAHDGLPEGWERVDDPQYGVYYIDHVNKRTQYENPISKGRTYYPEQNNSVLDSPRSEHFSERGSHFSDSKSPPPAYGTFRRNFFTRDPNELQGDFVSTTLVKSTRGLGFTIVGGDDEEGNNEEFLQIKSISPNGPAALDGKLRRSDVLVYVDGQCVLGHSHQDIIRLFQSIPVGETVTIDICRGYPLPFNPDDPSNEIITTVAVTSSSTSASNTQIGLKSEQASGNILSVEIAKGSMGFGFTIGDTPYGQCIKKVLDRSRCKGLLEGDLLVEINGTVVRNVNHLAVVEILKDCQVGSTAKILVQRGGLVPRMESENRRQEIYESRNSALLPSQQALDTPGNFHQSHREQGLKPAVYPKPTSLSRMVTDNQLPNVVIHQHGQSPIDHRMMYESSQIEARMYGSELETSYSVEAPRKPVQRGMSLRNDFVRQPLNDNDFGSSYVDKNSGFGQVDSQNQDSIVSSRRNLANLSFSEHTRGTVVNMQGQMRVRSKTPGPEFMRGARSDAFDRDPDAFMPQQALDTRREVRSKTPTQEIPRARFISRSRPAVSGTPDFIPASQYVSESSHAEDMMTSYPASSQPFSSRVHSSASSLASGDANLYGGQFADRTSIPPFRRSAPHMSIPLTADNGGRVPPSVGSWTTSSPASVASSRLNVDEQSYEMPVYLQRLQTGFGFRIIGGTEEGSQVSVGHVVPGGAADLDGQLRPGDEITFVNGMSVFGASHRKVVQLMTEAAQNGHVTLRIRRRAVRLMDGRNANADRAQYNYPYDVTLHRREYESFGFVMVSSTARSGSALGSIVEGSPADRSGVLHVGDRLLAVNGVNVSNLHHEHIVGLIKESGHSVVLTIGPPDEALSTPSSTIKQYPNVLLSSPSGRGFTSPSDSDMSQRSEYSPFHPSSVPLRSPVDSSNLEKSANEPYRRPFSTQPLSSVDDGLATAGGHGDRLLTVELQRGARGFGFSIRGGQEFNNMPLYVLKIADGGAAYVDGRLRVGDEILEINGRSTLSITHAEAIELIQSGNTSVRLLVKRTPVVRSTQPSWPPSHSKSASYSSNGTELTSNLPTNGLRPSDSRESRNTSSSSNAVYGQVAGKYQTAYR